MYNSGENILLAANLCRYKIVSVLKKSFRPISSKPVKEIFIGCNDKLTENGTLLLTVQT